MIPTGFYVLVGLSRLSVGDSVWERHVVLKPVWQKLLVLTSRPWGSGLPAPRSSGVLPRELHCPNAQRFLHSPLTFTYLSAPPWMPQEVFSCFKF